MGCVGESASQLGGYIRLGRTHTGAGSPHHTTGGQRKGSGRGVCVIQSLSHRLIIHNTVSSSILPLSEPDSTGGGSLHSRIMLLRRQVSTAELLRTGLLIRRAGASSTCQERLGADIADLYQCSGDGITLHLSTVCHQM